MPFKDKEEYNRYMRKYLSDYRRQKKAEILELKRQLQIYKEKYGNLREVT